MDEVKSGSDVKGGGGRVIARHRTADDNKLCYTIPEAAELIGVSRNHGYELARRGELPIVKMGKLKFVPKAKLHSIFGLDTESEEKS